MRISFEYATQLQYENKALREQIRLLKSEEAYIRLRKEYERLLEEKDREIRRLKAELEDAHRQSVLNDYSGPPVHLGRSLAQSDRASAHLIQSAFQHMPIAD